MNQVQQKAYLAGQIFFLSILFVVLMPVGLSAQSSIGDVWFAEPSIQTQTGQKFVTNVLVNTEKMKLAAYTFELSFNPAIITIDKTVGINGVTAGADGFFTVVNSNTAGKLTISSFDVNGKGPSTRLRLLSIAWIAVANGVTTIINDVKNLSNDATVTIGTPKGSNISVIVGAAATTPAVTQTESPVVTPSGKSTFTPTRTPTGTPTTKPTKAPKITQTRTNQ